MSFRAAYRDIELYEPGRTPIEIDLSDNTNLFGVAPSARSLLDALPNAVVTRYPTVFATPLKEALAQHYGVDVENITTGCGSDDVIDSAMRAFCEPGDKVVYPMPTFGIVGTFARMNATQPVAVPMRADFSFSPDEVVAAAGAVTYVCSPNNPTGSVVDPAQIRELDHRLGGLLLLDEAYADYGEVDYAQFAAKSEGTVSLRTFSKVYSLAGLRVGYAIGPRDVIHEIEKSRGPYKVNGVAEAVAARVLSADCDWVAEVIAQTREIRGRLSRELDSLGVRQLPSQGNFILLPLPAGLTALGSNAALRERGVATRPFTALANVGEALRVTVGPWPQMQRFLEALGEVLATGQR